jgi:diguanylate cyclase (GGDEF)-like protein
MARLFQNASIRVKAFAASVVLLICLVALGGHAYLTMGKSAGGLETLSQQVLPKQQAISELETQATTAHVKLFRFVTWASSGVNHKLMNAVSEEIRGHLLAIRNGLDAFLARSDLTDHEREILTGIPGKWGKYAAAVNDTLEVGHIDAPMGTMLLNATDDDFQRFAQDLHKVASQAGEQTRFAAIELVETARANRNLLAVGAVAGTLLSIFITLLVGRSIVEPVKAITRAMKEVSTGNIDFELGYSNRHDEIGQMVQAIDRFRQQLQTQNTRLDAALNNMSQGLCMFDAQKRVIICNERYATMYGMSPDDIPSGTALRHIVEWRIANGIYSGADPEAYLAAKLAPVLEPSSIVQEFSGDRAILISNQPMLGGGWVTTHEDISERRRAEKRIAHMAHHDALTDLPNRVLFYERLEQALARVHRGERIAVMCLDLDLFKCVNDTCGHAVGDALLKAVADRLRACARPHDTVARLGGDEFAIIQTRVERRCDVEALARLVRESIATPYNLDSQQVVIDTSIGIAIAPENGTGPDELMQNADIAAYAAKANGRGSYRFFDPTMEASAKARRALEPDLRRALMKGAFELYFQPFLKLDDETICGFEALLRWHHPTRGLIGPAEFIPLAEEIGLIGPIGEWVIRTACIEAARWPDHIGVSVNVSPAQLIGNKLVPAVVNALAASGLPAHRLELEVTESVLMHDTTGAFKTLHQLRAFGVRFSLDDFGTGYSSLSYLRSFPFDKIKIDRSFIADMSTKVDSVAIVRAVAGLASSLKMATAAEGVETPEQLELAKELGCTQVQGYLISPPRRACELADLLPRTEEWLERREVSR